MPAYHFNNQKHEGRIHIFAISFAFYAIFFQIIRYSRILNKIITIHIEKENKLSLGKIWNGKGEKIIYVRCSFPTYFFFIYFYCTYWMFIYIYFLYFYIISCTWIIHRYVNHPTTLVTRTHQHRKQIDSSSEILYFNLNPASEVWLLLLIKTQTRYYNKTFAKMSGVIIR